MSKRKIGFVFFILFLLTFSGVGDAETRSEHPLKTEQAVTSMKVFLFTVDEQYIAANYYTAGHKQAIIVLNDPSENINQTKKKEYCSYLAQKFDILNIDFRGLGESSGEFTEGNVEVLDIQAAVQFLRFRGYTKIGLLGTGFGGYMAIQGAAFIESVDSVAVIDAPYQLHRHDESEYKAEGPDNILIQFGRKFFKRLLGYGFTEGLGEQPRPITPYLESMKQPLLVIHTPWHEEDDSKDCHMIFKDAKHPKAIYVGKEEQVTKAQQKVIYARAADWFQHTFIISD